MHRRQRRVADFINLLRAHAPLLFRSPLNRPDGSNHLKVMAVFELRPLHRKHELRRRGFLITSADRKS